jgi:hypothetical protein
MAKKEISIVLRAKNELQVGLAKAGASLKSFGESALNVGKVFATAFVGAAASLTAFATKALVAYSGQETAVSALKASFRAYGDEIDVNTESIKQLASAMQQETGVGDEVLIQRAAKLKMLGVETDALGEALKATVALSQYGLEEEAAIKAVAQAREGNFSSLQRYIPALRSASTEAEKQIILNDFLARGYDAQKATLGTLAGQWGLLKNNVGDAWEEIGAAIAQNDTITKALEWLNQKAIELGQTIKDWVASGGIENFKAVMLGTLENVSFGFNLAIANIKLFFAVFRDNSAFQYFAGNVTAAVKTAWEQLKYLGGWAAAVWEKIKNPMGEFVPPSTDGIKNAFQGMLDAAKGKDVKETEHHAAAIKEREDLIVQHKARLIELENKHLAALDAVSRKRVENEKLALQASIQNNIAANNKIIAAEEKKADSITENARDRVELEEDTTEIVTDANKTAAKESADAWNEGYKSIADSSIAAADVAIESAERMASGVSGASGATLSGGTIESSSSYAQARLRAAGIDPNTPGGTVLSANDAMNLKNVTQDQILRELEKMNANQQKLLTFS